MTAMNMALSQADEQRRLDSLTTELLRQAEKLERPEEFANEADAWNSYCIGRVIGSRSERSDYLREHLERPYHARLIFEQVGGVQDMYVGRYDGTYGGVRVVDWRAPVAALLQPHASRRQQYGKYPEVFVCLKRNLSIQGSWVRELADLVPYAESWNSGITRPAPVPARPGAGPERGQPGPQDQLDGSAASGASGQPAPAEPDAFEEWEAADAVLLGRLAEASEDRLRDIVETIQQEQDALVRADLSRPLIVNGVAGSGKTSVAYHRLALLMYPEYSHDLSPRRIMVFAPNRFSLSYLRHLLPHLGVNGVQQSTLVDWMLSHLRLQGCQVKDRTLSVIQGDGVWPLPGDRAAAWGKSRTRGRQEVLDVCRLHLVDQILGLVPEGGCAVQIEEASGPRTPKRSLTLTLDAQTIRGIVQQEGAVSGRYAGSIRSAVYKALNDALSAELTQKGVDTQKASLRTFERIREALRRLDLRLFPARDVLAEARLLFSRGARLRRLAQEFFSPEEADDLVLDTALQASYRARVPSMDVTELPMLMAMQMVLRLEPVRTLDRFDYTVVDEGQDVSPLEYLLLSAYVRPGHVSIFGDLMQGIHAYRGVTSWKPVLDLFRVHPEDRVQALTRTYRSTREIVELSNEIIRRHQDGDATEVYLAEAVGRSGGKPKVRQCLDLPNMLSRLVAEIDVHLNAGHQSIGVITKSAARAEEIALLLGGSGASFPIHTVEGKGYAGGVTVLPVTMAKGLEFDVALVVDADERRYTADPYDARLLYVAITRGMHHVSLYTSGAKLTSLLPFA